MSVSTCPSCHESVTVPVEAQPESIVRCPLCHEEFQLKDFLAQLPPPLIILSPGRQPAAEQTEGGAVDQDSGPISFPQLSDSISDADAPAFDFEPGSAPGDESSGLDTSYAPLRRQKNPTVEIAKIVAGGLLALPLAQLILWWLPGKWQRDPLQIGPDVGRVVPWVVPANFRSGDDADASTASLDPDSAAATKSRARQGSNQAKANRKDGNDGPDGNDRSIDGTKHRQEGTKKGPENRLRADGENGASQSRMAPAPSSHAVLGVKRAPKFSANQLHEALEEAMQANVAWDFSVDVTEEAMTATTDQFYAAFAQLGRTITFADTSSGDVRSYVQTLLNMLTAFGEQPKKLAMIGNRGAQWLRQEGRPNDGALLFGTVKHIRYRGLLYETTVDLAARGEDRTVTVVSTRNPKSAFALQSRVLILGAVVNNPAVNMVGYRGDESQVVVAGFPVPLPE